MKQPNMVDTSYFFWLITYFLRFAAQLELDFEHVKRVLSYDILAYLAYEGVNLCEEFELNATQDGIDLKPCFQKMHLVNWNNFFLSCLSLSLNFFYSVHEAGDCHQRVHSDPVDVQAILIFKYGKYCQCVFQR